MAHEKYEKLLTHEEVSYILLSVGTPYNNIEQHEELKECPGFPGCFLNQYDELIVPSEHE